MVVSQYRASCVHRGVSLSLLRGLPYCRLGSMWEQENVAGGTSSTTISPHGYMLRPQSIPLWLETTSLVANDKKVSSQLLSSPLPQLPTIGTRIALRRALHEHRR